MAAKLTLIVFIVMTPAVNCQWGNYIGEGYSAGKSGGRASLYDMATTPSRGYYDEQAKQHDMDISISNGNYRFADDNARHRASHGGDSFSAAGWAAVGAYNQNRGMQGYHGDDYYQP